MALTTTPSWHPKTTLESGYPHQKWSFSAQGPSYQPWTLENWGVLLSLSSDTHGHPFKLNSFPPVESGDYHQRLQTLQRSSHIYAHTQRHAYTVFKFAHPPLSSHYPRTQPFFTQFSTSGNPLHGITLSRTVNRSTQLWQGRRSLSALHRVTSKH